MIPTKPFGRTGHDSTRIIFGAAAFSDVTQDEADATMELVASNGINHIDTAASYGDSELRLNPWLATHRDDVFLASKTGERTDKAAYEQIQRSLERLGTDHLDLIQLHALHTEEEWSTVFSDNGAIHAVTRARDEGLVRGIGVTGHGVDVPRFHLRSLAEFDFDSVLLPYSYIMMQNPQYAADFNELADLCRQRNVAVQTIKAITRSPWGDQPHTAATWYEPLTDQDAVDASVWWVLGNDKVFLNTVGDIHVLPKALDAAQRFEQRPDDAVMQRFADRLQMEPLFT